MATINNIVLPNVAKGAGDEEMWPQIWAMTRAMKKAGWKYLASSDGSSKDITADPALDYWGSGGSTGATGTDGTLGAAAGGRITFTSATGTFTAADKGRFLGITGGAVAANNHYHQIEEIISGTQVRLDARNPGFTPTDSGETNNGSLSWTVYDPTLTDVATGPTTRKWILMQGPSTLKIPITTAPVAGGSGFTFIRGENVSQATTGAEGEILGWVFDSVESTGYLVVLPRVFGSGADPYGWDDTYTITGATSGCTVDQDGTVLEYRHQIVIAKNTDQTQGWIHFQCIEPVSESASDFFTLAASAGCTATVQPSGGGTGNAFPALAWTALGYGGSSQAKWNGCNSARAMASAQIIAVDAIWEEDYSADGTFACYTAGAIPTGNPYGARGFYRLDDTEPGDVSPFVSAQIANSTFYSDVARYQAYSSASLPTGAEAWCSTEQLDNGLSTSHTVFKGWRRRGMADNDQFICCEAAVLFLCQSNEKDVEYQSTDAGKVATELVATKMREPLWVASAWNGRKMRKGTIRWLGIVQGGNPNDTYDDGRWIQLHNTDGCLVAGPWDQTSVPSST